MPNVMKTNKYRLQELAGLIIKEGAYSPQQVAATKAMMAKAQKAKSDMELVLKDLQKMAGEDRRFEGDVTYIEQAVNALNAYIVDADKFVIQGKV